ncbi:MAG: hypothetical protein ACOC9B_06535 [Chloroflexota bacterium]
MALERDGRVDFVGGERRCGPCSQFAVERLDGVFSLVTIAVSYRIDWILLLA